MVAYVPFTWKDSIGDLHDKVAARHVRQRSPVHLQVHLPRLELGPQQKIMFLAWLVENKGTPKEEKTKKGANSGEASKCRRRQNELHG